MSTEENQTLVRRLYAEVWSNGNLDVADELCSTDIVHHGPGDPTLNGLDAFKGYIAACRTVFPDMCIDVEELISEGNRVAVRWVLHGTHKGRVPGFDAAPTGKSVGLQGATIYRTSGGRLADAWTIREALLPKVTE